MLVDTLVTAVTGGLGAIIDAVLPTGTIGFTVPSALLVGYSWLDTMAPMHEMVQVAAAIAVMSGVIFVVRLALTVWKSLLP
jgi:hypothetical protein